MADEGRKGVVLSYNAKGFVFGITVVTFVLCGGWFGYSQIFTKGIERLSAEVCDGAVGRESVVRLLPSARSAHEEAEGDKWRRGEGDSVFACRIYTSNDSVLSGRVKLENVSMEDWARHYGADVNGEAVHVSVDGMSAAARLGREHGSSSVYVPCYSEKPEPGESTGLHALVAEAGVIGESRLAGAELRQAVTDFAYQLTKRAHVLGECQQREGFPEQLPRYASS